MSVIIKPYENRLLPFHADADYSTYGPIAFHGLSSNAFFQGSRSQTVKGKALVAPSDDTEYSAESRTPRLLDEDGGAYPDPRGLR